MPALKPQELRTILPVSCCSRYIHTKDTLLQPTEWNLEDAPAVSALSTAYPCPPVEPQNKSQPSPLRRLCVMPDLRLDAGGIPWRVSQLALLRV